MKNRKTLCLVAGATSFTGRLIIEKLINKGFHVRAMVRRGKDADYFISLGAEVVVADVCAPQTLGMACKDVDTVISLIGRHFAKNEEGFWKVDYEGNINLMKISIKEGIKHFVLMSALWADQDIPPFIFQVKRKCEKALMASGLPYSILRPPIFALGPSSLVGMLGPTIERFGFALIPGNGSKLVSPITPNDVADAFIAVVTGKNDKNCIYNLAGGETHSLRDWAILIGEIIGKKTKILMLPHSFLRMLRASAKTLGFGFYESVLFLEMLADLGYHGDPGTTQALLGREPESAISAIRSYYKTTKKTPWRDSNYGVLFFRSR